jgi:2-oxoglutarate ferredoxin oxidoreductase subunit gamma
LRRHERSLEKIEIRISGLGGQGVVLAGQILGRAAVYDGKNVVQTQSYGAEARGSMAKSEVIISGDKIGFPIVRKCDVLIAMNQDAVEKDLKDLKEDGILLVDGSTVKNVLMTNARIFKVSATQIAENSFGGKLYANMIMLGALTEITKIVSEHFVKLAIKDSVAENAVATNFKAFKKGEKTVSQSNLSESGERSSVFKQH